jgi:hypothetical protein
MGLKEIVYNYWTRNVHVHELNNSMEIHLKKMDAQTSVYGLELEITGNTAGNITLLFGPEKGKYQQEVVLKKGAVHYDFSSDWYDENCFIYLHSENATKADIEIDYRFYGSTD